MKLQKFVLLLIYMLLLCGTIYGYSTSSQISMNRVLSDSICLPGQEILVTITLQFDNLSNDAKGLYIADNIPSLLFNSLQTLSVELDGVDISDSVLVEYENSESVYDGAITVRWVLETPPDFNENLPVKSNQNLIVKYALTIPSDATENTKYSFPNASWVAAIDPFGTPTYEFGHEDFPNPYIVTIITDVEISGNIIPQEYILHQNYPNPFNPSTIIKYGVPEQSNIKIEIFNMLGQSVRVLVNTEKSAGFYETTWHAENLPSGIYLISIRAQRLSSKKYFTKVNKSLLLK